MERIAETMLLFPALARVKQGRFSHKRACPSVSCALSVQEREIVKGMKIFDQQTAGYDKVFQADFGIWHDEL